MKTLALIDPVSSSKRTVWPVSVFVLKVLVRFHTM